MTTREEPWPTGTPAWADLMTSDRKAASRFYTRLFGWSYVAGAGSASYYRYAMFRHRPTAGLVQAPPVNPAPPVSWTTYLSTEDIDKTCDQIAANGGAVLLNPVDIATDAQLALAGDPTGAVFGLWQPRNHIGAQVVNRPGAMCWNELMTPDPDTAREFYHAVFGYTYEPAPGAEDYTMVAGREGYATAIAGIGRLGRDVPELAYPQWMTYFAVEDTRTAAAIVREAGGRVLQGPMQTPYGPVAVCRDPQGGVFSVIRLPPRS